MKNIPKDIATLEAAVLGLKDMADFWDGKKERTIVIETRELAEKVKDDDSLADKRRLLGPRSAGARTVHVLK